VPDASQTVAPPSARRAVAWLFLAAAIVVGFFLVRRPDAPPPRPEPGDVLLSEEVPLSPLSRRVRVKMPCTLRVEVGVPPGATAAASLGVPQPREKSPEDSPDPETARRWTAEAGAKPHDEVVLAAGLYVLRIVPEGAGAGTMTVKVRALPP